MTGEGGKKSWEFFPTGLLWAFTELISQTAHLFPATAKHPSLPPSQKLLPSLRLTVRPPAETPFSFRAEPGIPREEGKPDPLPASADRRPGCRGTREAERSGRDGRRGAAHRATHRPAGKASPDALGAEDEARPLGEGAEAHAVEPDHPLGHGPGGRAAWGERRPSEPAPAEAIRQPARRGRPLPLPRLRE